MDDSTFDALVDALTAAERRVVEAVARVPADGWGEVIHTGDGAWTRLQLLAHIAANDLRQLVRVRIGAGIPESGDDLEHAAELEVHDWNRARVAERTGRPVESLMAETHANRAALIALLRRLTPAQRDRPMPFRGVPTPLGQMVPSLIGHIDAHLAELTAKRDDRLQ